MKKLIAIAVMIALVAGAVFADTSIAGAVETRMVVSGDSQDNTDAEIKGTVGTAWIQLAGSNDEGTMGGTFRIRGQDVIAKEPTQALRWHKAFAWWKPIPQLRFWMGQDADGLFEAAVLTGWGYSQGSEEFLCVQHWDFWRLMYPGNWDGFGLATSLYLVEGLDINIVIPTGKAHGWPRHENGHLEQKNKLKDVFVSGLRLTANYKVPDIGTIMFSWRGPYNGAKDVSNNQVMKTFEDDEYGLLGLSFLLNGPVQGLQAHLGLSYYLDANDGVDSPINIGLAVHYSGGDWGVKARVGSTIQTRDDGGLYIAFNVTPSYNFSGIGKVFLDFGLTMDKSNNDADIDTGWYLNPYIKTSVGGGGYVQAGVGIFSKIDGYGNTSVKASQDYIKFNIPILMGFNL